MSKKIKIFIVEDDDSLSKILTDKLVLLGYDVTLARTGKEALNKVVAEKPDFILLDIILPGGMNGFDVLENLKRDPNLKSIPVVVLTNLDSEYKTALDMGAIDYIVKSDISLTNLALKIKSNFA